ncbi:DUF4251 domain-containing protein [Niastella caeni]|uniref:DUF4251 domain-containing protein n=1 Tax=Niastella caeni TaxID=2569763 RepID=A0A4S8HIB8_9BACT|nr:DUF4251 domain-containing protein [Niastella caeni]THU34783.1 DUF4251 domain-containing protein [Niastella caeni]
MKNEVINRNLLLLLVIPVTLFPGAGLAQHKKAKKTAQIKEIVEARNYVFKAQTALPASGSSRQLTTDFDLRVSKDTIVSDLPYFGRAYTAPLNPVEGPLRFTSTDFQYSVTNRKKGGWDVIITPKDLQDPRQLTLNIFDNGTANVIVTSYNRQPISFNGYVIPKNN